MIPNEVKVESNLTGLESNEFSIQITDKSFKVLLDGLYTNKHQSIIRELWTNAYDSHVEAGIPDKPFVCKLPSPLDPSFYVRDFGVGLSHEDVMHLYSTVFASTKTDTNTQIGCLGLGSKSPFSYTDSFSVITYSGTEKRTYIAALNENGIPSITHFSTEECDEDRGMMVSFLASSSSINLFITGAQRVILGFDVPPKIIGATIETIEPIFSAETIDVYEFESLGPEVPRQDMIKMGPVMYPLPDSLTAQLRQLIQGNSWRTSGKVAVLKVNVGDIEFAANREAVQLTSKTRSAVNNCINYSIEKLKETAEIDILAADSYIQACKRFVSWKGMFPGLNLQNSFWNDDPSLPIGNLIKVKIPKNIDLSIFYDKDYEIVTKEFLQLNVKDIDRYFTFVVHNGGKFPRKISRLKAYSKTLSYSLFVLSRPNDVSEAEFEAAIKEFKVEFDLSDNRLLSPEDIPDFELPKHSKNSTFIRGVYRVLNYQTFNPVDDALKVPTDIPWIALESAKKGTLIHLNKLDYHCKFTDSYYEGVRSISEALRFIGSVTGKDETFLCVGPQAFKKLEELLKPEFQLETYLINKINEPKILEKIGETTTIEGPSPVSDDVYDLLNIPKPSTRAHATIPHLIHRYINTERKDLSKVIKTWDLAKKYPLLFDRFTKDKMKDYIDMCNLANEGDNKS